MWRVGILLDSGNRIAENFETKSQCEEWLLKQVDKQKIKKSIIFNKQNIQERFVETWE